jgi:urea transport system permease protein
MQAGRIAAAAAFPDPVREMSLPRPLLLALLALALLLPPLAARALTAAQAHAISAGDSDARVAALQQALVAGDPRVPVLVRALLDGAVRVDAERAYIVAADGSAMDAATGQPATLPAEGVEEAVNNNRMRGELQAALAALGLGSADAAERRAGFAALGEAMDEAKLPLVEGALAKETDAGLKDALELLRAKALVGAADPPRRLEAV